MDNTKILKMLNDGQIEELKTLVQDEIHRDVLKACYGDSSVKRYAAMKRFFKYYKVDGSAKFYHYPAKTEYMGVQYTAFAIPAALVLTKESCGNMEILDSDKHGYLDVSRILKYSYDFVDLDIAGALAASIRAGYKISKNEINKAPNYLLKYRSAYYKTAVVDLAYSILQDGKPVKAFQPDAREKYMCPLQIHNDIGCAFILPIYIAAANPKCDGCYVFEIKS